MTSPPERDFSERDASDSGYTCLGDSMCSSVSVFDALQRSLSLMLRGRKVTSCHALCGPLLNAGLGSEEVEHKTDGGMFSNENEDENIVDTIRRLKLNESGEKSARSSLLTREMLHGKHSDLFVGSDFGDKEITKSASDARAIPSEHIQLNRLLDDYLLGTKGDRIMKQMEELISDELADTTAKSSEPAEKQPSFVSTDLFGDEESDPSLDALTSMADFEKYISEN